MFNKQTVMKDANSNKYDMPHNNEEMSWSLFPYMQHMQVTYPLLSVLQFFL